MMNGYVCFWKGFRKEIKAVSSLDARDRAASEWKAKHKWDVHVMLAERGGEPVVHMADF